MMMLRLHHYPPQSSPGDYPAPVPFHVAAWRIVATDDVTPPWVNDRDPDAGPDDPGYVDIDALVKCNLHVEGEKWPVGVIESEGEVLALLAAVPDPQIVTVG